MPARTGRRLPSSYGTSVDLLERNYSFAIEDLEDEDLKPAVEERLRARQFAFADRHRQSRAA